VSRRVAEHPPGELRCVEGRPPEPTRGSAARPTAPRQAQQQQNREEGDQVLHNHDDGAMLSIMKGNGAQHLRLHLQHSGNGNGANACDQEACGRGGGRGRILVYWPGSGLWWELTESLANVVVGGGGGGGGGGVAGPGCGHGCGAAAAAAAASVTSGWRRRQRRRQAGVTSGLSWDRM